MAADLKNGFVIKRDGRREAIDLHKIQRRLENLATSVASFHQRKLQVNTTKIAQRTIAQMYDGVNGVSTYELDTLAAEVSAYITDDPDYELFAGNILASNLMANNREHISFAKYAEFAFNHIDVQGRKIPLVSRAFFDFATENTQEIDKRIVENRNYGYGYFAMCTLIGGQYLLAKLTNVIQNGVAIQEMVPFESPQHMWMRVALALHCVPGDDSDSSASRAPVQQRLEAAFELYEVLSKQQAIFGSPTLFQAGTVSGQLSSCFLLSMREDSIAGIYDTLKQCALISQGAGGVGLAINNVRSSGSYIAGTNGRSNGIVPMLRVYNATSRYVDQGGGKRKGSFAVYMSPWHADIYEFLDLRQNSGPEEVRARDLFLALWVSDLFMIRAQLAFSQTEPVLWSLFDPNTVRGLDDVFGLEFTLKYEEAERAGLYQRQVDIKLLFKKIVDTMIKTGTPYILFKDACNRKSNQQNLGTIHCSNLCTEIIQYTSKKVVATCNVGSISLPAFVLPNRKFDFASLLTVTRTMIRAFNRAIDVTVSPLPEAKVSNQRERAIGLGIQGLANVFMKMRLPFDSQPARDLNVAIAETMYFAALTESHALAVADGPYRSMRWNGGAPINRGIFQQDMWLGAREPDADLEYDWDDLREKIKKDGVRNSLLISHPPTASTSNIMGNYESFEPPHSNVFARKTKNGEFLVVNSDLVRDLEDCGLWVQKDGRNAMRDRLFASSGSIQTTDKHDFSDVPAWIRKMYKTVTEIALEDRLQMIVGRAQYVCQSSSNNVHLQVGPQMSNQLIRYIFRAHACGLKTGVYYTRVLQPSSSLDFAGVSRPVQNTTQVPNKVMENACTRTECTSCSG